MYIKFDIMSYFLEVMSFFVRINVMMTYKQITSQIIFSKFFIISSCKIIFIFVNILVVYFY